MEYFLLNITKYIFGDMATRILNYMKIYGIHLQTVESIPCGYLIKLMPKRYAQSQKYLRREDQLRCLGAGLLMHHVLGIEERDLQYGEYGKPHAPGKAEFNISHSGNWAVLAQDRQVVGVDIERINAANLTVAARVFTPNELSWMQGDPLVRFHILWTIKESIMKAAGLGMQLDPAQFHVLPIGGENLAAGRMWHTAWMLHDGCVVACASTNKIERLEFEEIPYIKEEQYGQ